MHPKALAHHQAGLNFQQHGNLRAAADEYERALAIDGALSLTRMNLAAVWHQLGDYRAAITNYRNVLEKEPSNQKCLYNLGVAYSALSQFNEAVGLFLRCLKLDGEFLPALTSLNWIYQQQGNTLGAVTVLTVIARLAPEDHESRFQLAVLLREQQRETEAAMRLRELVADHPEHLAGRLLLAELHAAIDPEGAWFQLGEIWARDQGFIGSRDLGERISRLGASNATGTRDLKSEAIWLERLLKLRVRDPDILRRLADLCRSLDRTARAISLYQEVLDLNPKDTETALHLATSLRRSGKRHEAQVTLSSVLHDDPTHPVALVALAELRLEAGRADQAEGLLKRALAWNPGNVAGRVALANVHSRLGRDDEAYAALKSLLAEHPENDDIRRGGSTLCRKLATQFQRQASEGPGDDREDSIRSSGVEQAWPMALLWWERYLEFEPEDAKALELLGALYRQRLAHRQAAATYERLAAFKPDAAVWQLLGSCRHAAGDVEGAALAFERALDLSEVATGGRHVSGTRDETVAIRVSLADALAAANRIAQSVTVAQDALARDPEHPLARELARKGSLVLAQAASEAGNHAEAAARWHYVLRFGHEPEFLQGYASSLEAAGNLGQAEAAILEILEHERDHVWAMRWLGERCLATLRPGDAERWFRRILEAKPNDIQAMASLADLAWAKGERKEAYDLYENIIDQDPGHIPSVLTFARDALAEGHPIEAWEYVRRILSVHPGQPEAIGVAQSALQALAESAEPAHAVEWWHRYLDLFPGDRLGQRGLWSAYHQSGAASAAASQAERLLAADTMDSEVAVFLADYEWRNGDSERARQFLAGPAAAGASDALLKLAAIERQAKNWVEVRTCLNTVLGFHPRHPEALEGLAEADLAEGRYLDAWERVEGLQTAEGVNSEVSRIATAAAKHLGRAREVAGRTQEAFTWWLRALQATSGEPEALHALFCLYRDQASAEEAAQMARHILSANPEDQAPAFYLAEYLIDRGMEAEAILVLRPFGEDPDATYLRACGAWKADDVSRTRTHLATVRRLVPRHKAAANLLGQVAKHEGDFEEAWNAFQEVLAFDPSDATARQSVVTLCQDAADALEPNPESSLPWVKRLFDLNPGDDAMHISYGQALMKAGRYGEGAQVHRELGERFPLESRWPTLEGLALRGAGRLDEAAVALNRARHLAPEDPAITLEVAQLAWQTGRLGDAFEAATDALRLMPDDGEARKVALHASLKLAEAARIAGDLVRIVNHLEQAARIAKDDAHIWRALAEARRHAGDLPGAAAAYIRVWEFNESDMEAAFLAAELFRATGDLPTARQLYVGILERDPGHRATLHTLARLLWQEDDRTGARWYLGRVLASLDEGLDDPLERSRVHLVLSAIAWQEKAFIECFDRSGIAMGLAAPGSQEWQQARSLKLRGARHLAVEADSALSLTTARKWWREVAALAPDDRESFRRLADISRESGEIEEARHMYRVLWDTDPSDTVAAQSLGEVLLAMGHRDEARVFFEEAAVRGASLEAALALARMAAAEGNSEAAWRWAQTEQMGAPTQGEATLVAADAALKLAERAHDAGNREQEAVWWSQLAILDVSGRDHLLPLARGQSRCGDHAAAAGTLLRLFELDSRDHEVARLLAETLALAGDLEGALLNYRRVVGLTAADLTLAETHKRALLAIANICVNGDRPEEGWEYSQALLALEPNNLEAKGLAAQCAQILASKAEADQDYDSALLYRQVYMALRPGDRDGNLKLAALHLAAGRREQAIGLFLELQGKFPLDTEIRLLLADALTEENPETARHHYEDVLYREPRNLHALASLGNLALRFSQLELAHGLFGRAADLADDPVPYELAQARVAWDLERPENAWQLVLRVLRRVPSLPEAVALGMRCCQSLAQSSEIQGDLKLARSYWESHVTLQPTGVAAIREVGRLARESGDLATAETWFAKAQTLAPDDLTSAFELGLLKITLRDRQGARRIFASILETDPHHRGALLATAELNQQEGDEDGAWYYTQELLALDPTSTRGLQLFTDLAKVFAARCASEGDLKASVAWWELAYKQVPSDAKVLRSLADAQTKNGEPEQAAENYQRLLELMPADLEVAHKVAEGYHNLGNLPKAEAALRRVVDLDPRHAPSILLLLAMAKDRKDPREVMKRAYDLLDLDSQDPHALFELAWAHNALLEKKAALQTYEELLAQSPHHAESWHQVAQLYRDLDELEPARKAATNAIVYGPVADFHVTLGTIYGRLGLWDEATAAFGQALDLDPNHADALAQCGFGFLQQRQMDKAKTHLERAVDLLPKESEMALEVRCALDLL